MIKDLFEKFVDWIKEICTINSRLKKLEKLAFENVCPNCKKNTLFCKIENCCERETSNGFIHTEKRIAYCNCGYYHTLDTKEVPSDTPVTNTPRMITRTISKINSSW